MLWNSCFASRLVAQIYMNIVQVRDTGWADCSFAFRLDFSSSGMMQHPSQLWCTMRFHSYTFSCESRMTVIGASISGQQLTDGRHPIRVVLARRT